MGSNKPVRSLVQLQEGRGSLGAEGPVGAEGWRGLESRIERNGLWRAGSSGPGGRRGRGPGCEGHDVSRRGVYLGVYRCLRLRRGGLSVIRNLIRARYDSGCKKTNEPQAEVKRKGRRISRQ